MNIQLIKATEEDADDLIIIQEQAFKRLYDIYHDERNPYLKGKTEFLRWLNNPDVYIYKIYADNILCGGITVYKKQNNEYYLARLYILPELQNKSIASKAIKLCETIFSDAKKWTLDFPIDQIANKKCYEKAGYIDTGFRDIKNDKLTLALYEKVINGISVIRKIQFEQCIKVIRESFATVAKDFEITEQNCPNHTSFIKLEKLQNHFNNGYFMFGYFLNGEIIGYFSLSKFDNAVYELHNLSVLPDFRHKGYGKELIDFCKNKVKELEGSKIVIGIIEENSELKTWYLANGFVHTGTKIFEHLPFTVGYMRLDL